MAAAFDHVKNINDVSFKARYLNTLINDYVPNKEHTLSDYSKAKIILNDIQVNELLSESEVDGKDPKGVQKWKRAVDLWEERLLELVSGSSSGNCWFGLLFLGLTSQKISSKRFEASYALWFQKLLPLVQLTAATDYVKATLWTALSDILTRLALSNYPDGKKDGVSFAGKLVQPLLNSLSETNSPNALMGATHLTCTLVTFFPTSVNRHSDAFEVSIVRSLFSEKNHDKLMILAQCLAELPKSKGDEMSWCSMMQKLLISITLHLNYVFQGLEEDSINDEAIRRLAPPGTEGPPPLGGQKVSAEAAVSVSKYLLLCCSKMLTSSYPVPVTVPVKSILALIERVLMVDGSLAKSTYPFITARQQESACSQLPILHEHCLDMLAALIMLLGSALQPHICTIEMLLKEYFNRCALPNLRVKIYSTLQIILKCMGSGTAQYIRKFVIKNIFADLEPFVISMRSGLPNASNKVSKEPLLVPCDRKRRHSVATESPELQHRVGFEVQATSLMVAALEALNTLLLKDGLSKDDNLKSQVEILLIYIANAACKKRGWDKHSSTWADFQVASLKALETSFLSSTHVRPPHLAEGLMLFRRGALQAGTKISDVCTYALASLEVVIHPRARSVADFASVGSNYLAIGNSAYQKDNAMRMGLEEQDVDDDILFRSWLENEYEAEIPTADPNKKADNVKQPLPISKRLQPEIFTSKSDDVQSSADAAQAAMNVDLAAQNCTETTDEVMVEQKQLHEPVSQEGPTAPGVLFVGTLEKASQHYATVSQASNFTPAALLAGDGFNSTTQAAQRSTTTMFQISKAVNTDDMDTIPDIVDAEPDSDSE